MSNVIDERYARRLQLVEKHVRLENAHDLTGILNTFGKEAAYEDAPWNDLREGADAVRAYYGSLLAAVPDLHIDIRHRHASDDAVILEVEITGTHLGAWRGLPATGRPLRFPLCGIFTFDDEQRLVKERIYYDRAGVLHQLGVFREPTSLFGRLTMGFVYPLTIARAYARSLMKRMKSQ
jgi:steroid delta-isomerase-like uncharacterized protein